MMAREMSESQSRATAPERTGWDRWGPIIGNWLPYLLLAIATALTLLQANANAREQLVTLLLAFLAAAWVFLLYSRAPEPREANQLRMVVYFAGFLLFASVLMARQPLFFIFAITGFFHAAVLRPRALTVAGVAATSIIINTIITGFPWQTTEAWFMFVTIIVVQTLAFGGGMIISDRLAEQSEQRRQAVAELQAALEENAALQAQLVAQAREAGAAEARRRMAREIHDTLAPGLTGIITQVGALEQARERPDDWQRHLNNAMELARECPGDARRSGNALRPEPLESARLPDALANVAQKWSALNGVPVQVTTSGTAIDLHGELEFVLLRTAQEALANIARHAHASRVGLTLSYVGNSVILDIRDDGVGFTVSEVEADSSGYGLVAMRERLRRIGGQLSIESEPGAGTAISAAVPVLPAVENGGER